MWGRRVPVSNIRIEYIHGIRQAVQHIAALRTNGLRSYRVADAEVRRCPQEAFIRCMTEIGMHVDSQLIIEATTH